MLEMSDLASSLKDVVSGLGRAPYRSIKHVVVKGRDAGDERPGLESRRFHVWPRGRAPYRSIKTCFCEGQRCWR
jgi:hypothetical protein